VTGSYLQGRYGKEITPTLFDSAGHIPYCCTVYSLTLRKSFVNAAAIFLYVLLPSALPLFSLPSLRGGFARRAAANFLSENV
jgi:hypothetical protein